MNKAARYVKMVEWSDEDNCFVGSCPGLFYGGCHGDDEQSVFADLCQLVEEIVELYAKDGKTLPGETAGRDWADLIAGMTSTPARHSSGIW
jgi:predicted RNase H-like HicB family nuclease